MSRTSGAAIALVVGLVVCPREAEAQCSKARFSERTGAGVGNSGTCSGTDPSQQINFTRKWDVTAETDCNDGGWKKGDQGGGVLTGIAHGQCGNTGPGTPPVCQGTVDAARDLGFSDGTEVVGTTFYDATWNSGSQHCDYPPSQDITLSIGSQDCTGEFCCGSGVLSECQQAQADFNQSNCECNFATPILIDMNGDGFRLTDFEDGVLFDLQSNGVRRQVSWTAADSDDAFLFLDRNGNGAVDGGTELFGNYTPFLGGPSMNGFVALATLDSSGDGTIDRRDPAYWQLQLWTPPT